MSTDQPTAPATPRTNAVEKELGRILAKAKFGDLNTVDAAHAMHTACDDFSTLERELSSAQAEIDRLTIHGTAMAVAPDQPTATATPRTDDITGNAVFYTWFNGIFPEPKKSKHQRSNWAYKRDMAHLGWCAAEAHHKAALAEAKAEVARLQFSITTGAIELTALRAALDVAEGALKEIQECADAIKRNLREDIEPTLRDNMWVITAACHATVIEQALARIAEARKGQP